ncbi:putative ribonuclease H-like domain-containing protein [Tanacetum coccineum]
MTMNTVLYAASVNTTIKKIIIIILLLISIQLYASIDIFGSVHNIDALGFLLYTRKPYGLYNVEGYCISFPIDILLINTARPEINTSSREVSTALPEVNTATPEDLVGPSPASEDTQVEDQEIKLGNIPQSYAVPTTPHTRIHKDHPIEHVIGDVQSSVQTRRMTTSYSELGFLSAIYEGKSHQDLHTCLFACFLSQEEPKRVSKALSDPAWVEAMQEELLQFKLQKVWILVDLPKGHRAIGTKWVYRNKKDERGIVIRNKARLMKRGSLDTKLTAGLWVQFHEYCFIYIDNNSTICIIENPVQHSKTKHIEIRHHFIRDCNAKKLIQMAKIDTEHNVADLLTKGFDAGRFQLLDFKYWNAKSLMPISPITATIDGHSMTITEASLRRHLKLDDHDSITSIPNSEIFKQLALMGYHTDSDKLTFQKGAFSPQWRFLIHTILHCLSPKKTAWEQFSSNIATVVICLATNRRYNFSSAAVTKPILKGGGTLFCAEVQGKQPDTEPIIKKYVDLYYKVSNCGLGNLTCRHENFMYYKIIRGDGSSKNYKILSEMLYDFDRQDIMELYRLVKERYSSSKPEGYDLMLWGDLHTLFEPDEESEIWMNQNEYNLISWSLCDFCGVHILLMQNGIAIHMLTEKKYPLSQEMLSKMLSKRLEVDHESTQAYELLKFIRSQVQK